MNTRISMQSVVQNAIADTRRLTEQLAVLQTQASTGKRFAAVSDDPAAALTVLNSNTQAQTYGVHLQNIDTATSRLNASVAVLQQVSDIFTQAKSVAIEGSSTVNDAGTLETLAQSIDALINRQLSLANTRNDGAYTFAGTATQTQPFVIAGADAQGRPHSIEYKGAEDATTMFVDRVQQVALNYSGAEVFRSDAFQTLLTLRDHLRNTSNLSAHDQLVAISNDIAALDQAHDNVLRTVGAQSAALESLESLRSHLQDLQLNAQKTASDLGDADLSEVVVKLQAHQNMLQLSLAAFSRMISQNLLEFLR